MKQIVIMKIRSFSKLLRCLITFCIVMSSLYLNAQNYNISGKVTDSLGVPVPFVSVGIEGSHEGTFTNENGEFSINLENKTPVVLTVSHIAYKKQRVEAPSGEYVVIKLSEARIMLQEVTVSRMGLNFIKKAFEKIIESGKKYSAKGFYRQITGESNEVTNIIECYYSLNMNTISNAERYRILNGRYGVVKRDSSNFSFNINNFKYYPLGFSNAKKAIPGVNTIFFPMIPNVEEFYSFSVAGIIRQEDEREILKIRCSPEQKLPVAFEGYYYIDKKTFNIERIEGEVIGEIGLSFSDTEKMLKSHNNGFSIVVSYKEIDGYAIPGYIHMKTVVNVSLKGENKEFKTTGTLFFFEYSDKVNRKGVKNSIKTHDFKEISKVKYDPVFWKENNPVKYTTGEEEAVRIYDKNNYFGTYFKD